jgi:hypothetical protein
MYSSGVQLFTRQLQQDHFLRELGLHQRVLSSRQLRGATFTRPVTFDGAKFQENVSFEESQFQKDASFNAARFLGDADLNYTSFGY